MLATFFLFTTLSAATLLNEVSPSYLRPRELTHTSRFIPLKRIIHSSHHETTTIPSYNTIIRPTNQQAQHVIEVHFNNVPRYLLPDTGSADTWMISSEFQCLNTNGSSVPRTECLLGDAYTGPNNPQIRNETYYQIYGTGEIVSGPFRHSNVTVAGLTVQRQKVALVDRGYILGDQVRSGVLGLAPRAVSRLFQNTNTTTSPPNGSVTPYNTVFENMYSPSNDTQPSIAPFFSLAFQRGASGGYIAFGGLPPVDFAQEFVFTPFQGLNYFGRHDPTRYYPIQPDGFKLNGANQATKYRAIVDSGTGANRLPQDISDRVNAVFDPPAIYNSTLQLYLTACNATAPSFALDIGNKTFTLNPQDMLLPFSLDNVCATSITKGLDVDIEAYPEGFYILGGAFLNNVIAVFDVEAGGMRFAPHEY